MNNKNIYEAPEIIITKFEVDKDIMDGEDYTSERAEMPTGEIYSGPETTTFGFDFD